MTDTASKARECIAKFRQSHNWNDANLFDHIAAAISAAVAEERERAGKLVDAAKDEERTQMECRGCGSFSSAQWCNECIYRLAVMPRLNLKLANLATAVSAYEVQP